VIGRRSLHGSVDRNIVSEEEGFLSRSLPSRERGSKHHIGSTRTPRPVSLPSRERGSKQLWRRTHIAAPLSLPSRERGSKPFLAWERGVDLWCRSLHGSVDRNVDQNVDDDELADSSLPSRERGSKPSLADWLEQEIRVAPFTGAWIETRP